MTMTMPAQLLGFDVDPRGVPPWHQEAFTLPLAAQVFGLDYDAVRIAVNNGDLDTFRVPTKRGTLGRRMVRRDEMIRWIKTYED